MWGAAIIVFREVFEIAIILSVVFAATTSLKGVRGKWIALGFGAGVLSAVVFALITQMVLMHLGPAAKQYFNAGILLTAVLMVGWTVIWMKQQSKSLTQNIKEVGQAISSGQKPLYILATIICLAVMREGSEIVVFLYGLAVSSEVTGAMLLGGSFIGLVGGSVFGILMYQGLLRISIKYTFQVLSLLLTFIAAGMAANAAGKLVKADLLPAMIQSLWNTADILPQKSLIGKFLFILVGYQENPNLMQVIFYAATFLTIVILTKRQEKNKLLIK